MPPFTGSDVPLEEDILKKKGPRDFFPTFLEFAADNNIQVIRSTITTGTETLFTVPDRQTLFITEGFVSISTGSGTSGTARLLIQGQSDFLGSTCNVASTTSESLNFRKAIKVESGQVVQSITSSGAGIQAISTGFSGFLVDKKIS